MWQLKQLYPQLKQEFESSVLYNFERIEKNIYLHPKKDHKYTMIWLHGLTGSADSYKALFNNPEITPLTSEFKVTMITAPERVVTKLGKQKFTSWMDIYLDDWYNYYETKPFDQLFSVQEAQESLELIKNVLEKEIAILKDPSKVFIGGMSQGCVMSLYAGLTSQFRLGGILGFSGFFFPLIQENEQSAQTPILISHGKEDKDIPWTFAEKTYQKLTNSHKGELKYQIYEDLGHSFKLESFELMKQFIQKQIK